MHTFQITIQRQVSEGWPVVVEQMAPGQFLPVRHESLVRLDVNALRSQPTSLEYGTALGKAIFSGATHGAFLQALAASGNALRVLLCVEADELKSLRWQMLCGPLDNEWSFLALHQRSLLSLYLPAITDRRFPSIGRRDLRALVLVSSPTGIEDYGLTPFDVEATVASLRAAFAAIPCDILANVEGCVGPPSLDAFCDRIVAERYPLVHIVCHGTYNPRQHETSLFLSGVDGFLDRVSGSRLLERLSQLDAAAGLPHLVFLAACETASPEASEALGGLAQRLVGQLGMPAVIAMTDRVTYATAQELASGFYRSLLVHGEVDRALTEAAAALAGRGDILVPALFSRLGERPLFSQAADRPLTPAEIAAGLDQLLDLLAQRAPVLLPAANIAAKAARSLPTAADIHLSATVNAERVGALADLNGICLDALDMDFHSLALGELVPPYDGRCPFRGLASFRPEDRALFFGRDPLVSRLTDRLRAEHFLALVGGSGCGKSSLALAGIGPAMQETLPGASLLIMKPGREPLRSLDALLGEPSTPVHDVILIVDQFEELFTATLDEPSRQEFLTRLTTLARRAQQEARSVYILVTLRAEFLGESARYPDLRELLQQHQELVAPMNHGELRRAMEDQAGTVGLRFEADLANAMLDGVAREPGAMPLLQHALLELWKRRHGRWLRASEYRTMGGVKRAIAGTANDLYAQLTADDQARMQRLFLRLVHIDPGEDLRDTRRRASLDEMARSEADRVATIGLVERLADARLVVTSVNAVDGSSEVELAHEAMIEHWERLQQWLSDNRQGLLVLQQVALGAEAWNKHDRDSSYLFQGQRLQQVRRWAYANEASLSQPETAFLARCWRQTVRRRIVMVVACLLAVTALVGTSVAIADEQLLFSRHLERSAVAEFSDLPVTEFLACNDGTLLVGIGRDNPREGDIARSQDGGRTWAWESLPGEHVAALTETAPDPGFLYALVIREGLFRSHDGGAHWRLVTSTLPITTYDALVASPDGVLYVGDYIKKLGVFSSTDGGYHWVRVEGSPDVAVFDLAWVSDHLAVGSSTGLWIWSPGSAWVKWPADAATPVLNVVAWEDMLLAGGGKGIVEVSFDAIGSPRSSQPVTLISVGRRSHANRPPQALAGSYDGHLLYTTSRGDWRFDERIVLPFVYAIRPDPIDPDMFWVATKEGLEHVHVHPWYRP
jgi:energy-coupling factor transporter ATP-binding protein EcfA2